MAVATMAVAVHYYQSQTNQSGPEVNNVTANTQEVESKLPLEESGDQVFLSSQPSETLETAEISTVLPMTSAPRFKESSIPKFSTAQVKVSDVVSTELSAPGPGSAAISVKKAKMAKPAPKVSGAVILTGVTDMKRTDDDAKSYDAETEVILGYALNDTNKLSIYTGFDKQINQARTESIKNTKLRWLRSRIISNDLMSFSLMSVVILPTNEDSRRRDELNFALELNPSLVFPVTDSLTLTYLPRVVKNFHKFETSKTDSVLVEYQLVQFFVASYQVTDQWYIEPTLVYQDAISYQGTERDDQFLAQIETGYALSSNLSLAVGIANSGKIINNEAGPNESIEILNEKNSTIYGSLEVVF